MGFLWLDGKNTFLAKHVFLATIKPSDRHTLYTQSKVKGMFFRCRVTSEIFYVRLDMGCLMNRPKICLINLLWESGLLHRLSAILSFWPCWEWWLDPSQPAIDGLALDQDDWVALLSMHVYIAFVCSGGGGVWLYVLTLHACCSRWTTAHLCHSISSLSFEFWAPLIICGTAVLRPRLVGCSVGRYSCERVFLTSPSNYYQDTAECNPSGNEHSRWHFKSIRSARWGSVWDVK